MGLGILAVREFEHDKSDLHAEIETYQQRTAGYGRLAPSG